MEGMMVVKEKKRNKNYNMVLRGVTWHFIAKINGKKVKRALSQSITEARRLRDDYLRELMLHGAIPDRRPKPEA